jgi:putative SOS response-associated peptidase YedK
MRTRDILGGSPHVRPLCSPADLEAVNCLLRFDTSELAELHPRDNIAPMHPVAAVLVEDVRRALVSLRWGLIPSCATDPAIGNLVINALSETVADRPAVRAVLER